MRTDSIQGKKLTGNIEDGQNLVSGDNFETGTGRDLRDGSNGVLRGHSRQFPQMAGQSVALRNARRVDAEDV